jgi:hypothetical protein
MKRQILSCLFAMVLICPSVSAQFGTNFYRVHDIDFKSFEWEQKRFKIGAFAEYGSSSQCRDWDENKTNILKMYSAYQSSFAMLLGAPKGSDLYKIALKHSPSQAPATADSKRGRFDINGTYQEFNCAVFGKYKLPIKSLPGNFDLGLFVPFKVIHIKDVSWVDQTENVLVADLAFKDEVSDQLSNFARTYGNLNVNQTGWNKAGIGDMVLMLSWNRNFKQVDKEYLKNVKLISQLGISIPTASEKDEDQSLAKPLGNDGAWGVPLRAGLHLDFIHNFCAGIEFDFFGSFATGKVRRLKTENSQTDFLLLSKGDTTKMYGPAWRFHLFAQANDIIGGLGATIGYQFLKNDADRLSPKSNDFSYNIINSAESLKEWNAHNLVFAVNYTPCKCLDRSFTPRFNLFYKLPLTGKRAVMASTFGGQLSVTF